MEYVLLVSIHYYSFGVLQILLIQNALRKKNCNTCLKIVNLAKLLHFPKAVSYKTRVMPSRTMATLLCKDSVLFSMKIRIRFILNNIYLQL